MLVDSISRISRLEVRKILAIERNASKRYKTYEIQKRSGGNRTIHHPSRELKALQRIIGKLVLDKLPVHPYASAYEKGSCIKINANFHSKYRFTTRVDFRNFFPSFLDTQVKVFLQEQVRAGLLDVTKRDIAFVANIACRHGRLTIGAPSSPKLTNRMMYPFDSALSAYCEGNGLFFTRYADDIFVSAMQPDKMIGIDRTIQRLSDEVSKVRLNVNYEKTVFLSRKNSKRITGLIITPSGEVSMGRAKKREIKALVHTALAGKLAKKERARLSGLLSFANDVEPSFLDTLLRKYGESNVEQLR